jgi:hypothetical protein
VFPCSYSSSSSYSYSSSRNGSHGEIARYTVEDEDEYDEEDEKKNTEKL